MRFSFTPREKKFFDLFENLAEKVVEVAEFLKQITENYHALPQIAKRLEEVEDETDTIVHQISDLTYQTFVTPFDTEDIRSLVHKVDNVVDNAEDAVYELSISGIEYLPPIISEFSKIISQTAEEIKKAMYCLRKIKKQGKVLSGYCIKINELENEADRLHRSFRKIVAQDKSGIENVEQRKKMQNLKATLDYLEEAMDQSEDVADIFETMRIKYA